MAHEAYVLLLHDHPENVHLPTPPWPWYFEWLKQSVPGPGSFAWALRVVRFDSWPELRP